MVKKLVKIVGILVALLVVGLIVVYLFAGSIIRPIVASTASSSLKVPTTLGGADLRAFAGNLTLSDLNVSNPQNFEGQQFVAFKTCSVTVQPTSLMGSTVKIDEINIDGLTLCMEQRGMESNVTTILKNLQAASGTSQGGSKQLAVEHIVLTNIKIVVLAGGLPGMKAQGFNITLPSIKIDRPMDPEGRLPKMANLMGQILTAIAEQAAKDPNMPGELRDAFGSATKFTGNFSKNLQTQLQNQLQNTTKGALDGLGNLFNNKKKDENK